MEEIEIKELLNHFKNNIAKVVLIVLLCLLIGCFYMSVLQKEMFTSSTTLVLTGIEASDTTITTNDITINSKLVTTYREIAKSRKVLSQVISLLNLEESTSSLASYINISSVSDTEIIRISVTTLSASKSKLIASALANVFSKEIQEIYNVENVSILDEADLPSGPSNINRPKQVVLYTMIGFMISLFYLFLTFYFDTTIKSVEQVEQKISLPILGSVPNYGKKGKK